MAEDCGKLVMRLLEDDVRPSRIITDKSIANGIACVAATGGSTNAVLHLMALAKEAGVELKLDEQEKADFLKSVEAVKKLVSQMATMV